MVAPDAHDNSSPSGRQHEIRLGDQVAVVTEVGATLRSYRLGTREVLDGFAADARSDGGRGQILAPWPNRVRDGKWNLEGDGDRRTEPVEQQLALSEAAKHNAIHGLVRWVSWELTSPDEHDGPADSSVALTTTIWPQPGYPFRLALRATYRLGDDGLTVALSARNDSASPAPYGVGQHPYLSAGVAGSAQVDDLHLTLPARTRLLLDDRGVPVGQTAVEGTEHDFRTPRAVGGLVLDDGYGDLLPDPDGRVRVRLDIPGGPGTELWAEGSSTRWLQVFSGDTLAPDRRRQGLAVEPMSCPPNALASGVDLVMLAPGVEHLLSWGVRAW